MSRESPNSQSERIAALLTRHHDVLFSYVYACVQSFADVDDILQEVAVAVIREQDPPTEDRRFVPWAREIARRRVLEFYRRSKALRTMDPDLLEQLALAADTVESRQPAATHSDALQHCMEELSRENQDLLAARYSDEGASSIAHVAAKFHRSEQGVVSLLYRLRKLLRACIERRTRLEGTA